MHITKESIQDLEDVGAQYTTYLQASPKKCWGFEILFSVLSYARDENKCEIGYYNKSYAYVFKGTHVLVFESRFSITLRYLPELECALQKHCFQYGHF